MKKNNTRLAAFALATALAAALPRAAGAVVIRPNAASSPAGTVPNNVNYQGRLVDNGFPVTGFRNVIFRIYDQLTLGVPLQTIGPQQVSVNQGLFSTTIAISTQALAGPLQKFLEVQVGSQVLAPRETLNSVPYALVAKSLEENLAISTVSVGTQLISSGTLAVASIQALNNSTYFSIISNAHMSSSTLTLDGNAATALTTVGNVGIGTANPGSKLNVSSGTVIVDGNAATSLVLDNSASLPVLRFREAGADKGTIKSVSGSVVIDGDVTGSHDVLINTNSSGNVGVGAAIPGTKFDVAGNAQFGNAGTKTQISALGALTIAPGAAINLTLSGGFVTSKSSVNASAFFGDGANISNVTAVAVPASGVTPGTFQNGTYVFQSNTDFPGTSRITSTGRLGVGTQSPATKLHLSSGTLTIDGNVSPAIVTVSSVGIGGAPTNPLSVTGNANVTGTFTANTMTPTNPLGTQYGGTGQNWSAVAQGAVPYFNGAGTMTTLPANTDGLVLTTHGAGLNPTWASPSVGNNTTLTNGKIWIGSALGLATENTVGGDATMTNAGSVTVTKINGNSLGTTTPTSGNILIGNGASWATQGISGNASLTSAGVLSITSLPAISGANLTNLTAANIAAGTAGINISGNAATVTTNANLTGNVTSVGNATTIASLPAISGANLTNLTAANIAAGTAGINISGNAATATTATTANRHAVSTLAGFIGTTPAATGIAFYCSDCTVSAVCVSTGIAAGQWSDIAGRATACK